MNSNLPIDYFARIAKPETTEQYMPIAKMPVARKAQVPKPEATEAPAPAATPLLCLCMRTELWLMNSGEPCQQPAVGLKTIRLRADGTPIRIPVCASHAAKGKVEALS